MKNRVWRPRAVLTAFAVIAVTLGLTTSAAGASVAKPASSATPTTVAKIHETKCTSTTLSVRYEKGKKVACYTGQGFVKVALSEATQATAGSSGGFLLLKEDRILRLAPFFPRERLPLAGRTEVTGIALSPLRVTSPKADSADQSTRIPGTAAYTVNMTGGNVTLTAASDVDAALINSGLAAGVHPEGLGCHFTGWPWNWYCYWKFTHAQTVTIYRATKASAITFCTTLLKHLGHYAVTVCVAAVEWVEIHHRTAPGKNQCLAIELHIYGATTVNYVKC